MAQKPSMAEVRQTFVMGSEVYAEGVKLYSEGLRMCEQGRRFMGKGNMLKGAMYPYVNADSSRKGQYLDETKEVVTFMKMHADHYWPPTGKGPSYVWNAETFVADARATWPQLRISHADFMKALDAE